MSTNTRTLAAVVLAALLATAGFAQDFAGPELRGTATLRSGETMTGLIRQAQLGLVEGAEIGARLPDGGYIGVRTDAGVREIPATEIASIDVEWAQTGTAEEPRWKITELTVATTAGETIIGRPTWLVHATSLVVEAEDGTQQRAVAFPLARSDFSPENLMTRLELMTEPAAPAEEEPAAPAEQEPAAPAEEEPAAPAEQEPAAPAEEEPAAPAEQEPAAPAETTDQPAAEATAETPAAGPTDGGTPTADVSITAVPNVEDVPEGTVFASGQPAVITFEIINPETGNPMRVRFLMVPLPAE